mmetsp:Transcript_14101/g.17489  ORF Transcript_14101/g.17489 Transcript_14101/m.17489 type:complete len:245 (-) Transcript_14101:1243-1977(-)
MEMRAESERQGRKRRLKEPSTRDLKEMYLLGRDRLLNVYVNMYIHKTWLNPRFSNHICILCTCFRIPKDIPSPDSKLSAESHMRTMINTSVSIDVFSAGLDGDTDSLAKSITVMFRYVASLSGFSKYYEINSTYNEIKRIIPKNKKELESKFEDGSSDFDQYMVATRALRAVHVFIDTIEDNLFQQVQMQKNMRRQMLVNAHKYALSKGNDDTDSSIPCLRPSLSCESVEDLDDISYAESRNKK